VLRARQGIKPHRGDVRATVGLGAQDLAGKRDDISTRGRQAQFDAIADAAQSDRGDHFRAAKGKIDKLTPQPDRERGVFTGIPTGVLNPNIGLGLDALVPTLVGACYRYVEYRLHYGNFSPKSPKRKAVARSHRDKR